MSFFGKKNTNENDSMYIANILTNTAGKIVKRGLYDRASIEFLKLSLEYNLLIRKNEIDEDHFLTEKLDHLVKTSQEDARIIPNMRGKDTISIFETLPDLIKSTIVMLKDKERIYEDMNESAKNMIEQLDKLENEKRCQT
jgi:hypothetical protein